MSALSGTVQRLALDLASQEDQVSSITGKPVKIWQAGETLFQCGLFDGGVDAAGIVTTVGNLVTANLIIRRRNAHGPVLLSKTISSFQVPTWTQWENEDLEHFVFDLSATDTNQIVPTNGVLSIYYVIKVNTTTGSYVAGQGYGEIVNVGLSAGLPTAPPTGPFVFNGLLTVAQLTVTGTAIFEDADISAQNGAFVRNVSVGANLSVVGDITAPTATITTLAGATATFSGTVRGKLQDKGGAVYHVKSYGLVGDGTTDDTVAFQALCDVVKTAGGGTILFDKGTFILNAKVAIANATKLNIQGAGKGVTILKTTIPVGTTSTGDATMLSLTSCGHFRVSDITFDGNDITTTQPITFTVFALSCNDFTFANCEFINQKRNVLGINQSQRFWIANNYIFSTGGNIDLHSGIMTMGGLATGPGWILNNDVVGTTLGGDGSDITVDNNRITGSTSGAGINSSGVDSGGVHFAARWTITNNIIDGSGGEQDGLGLWISGIESDAYNSIVAHNIIRKAPGIGIALGGKYQIVNGNEIYDCGRSITPGIAIANNYQNTHFNASYCLISNNVGRNINSNFQTHGFKDVGSVGQTFGITFNGNDFSGNTTTPFELATTSINYLIDNSRTFILASAAAAFPTLEVPAGCKTVRLAIQARGVDAALTARLALRFNGDTGNNYNFNEIGEIVNNGTGFPYMIIGELPAATAPAGQSCIVNITIPNISMTTFKKGLIALNQRWSGTFPVNSQIAGNWFSTAAITAITILGETNNLAAGSAVTATFEF